jgi:hypothetical protein
MGGGGGSGGGAGAGGTGGSGGSGGGVGGGGGPDLGTALPGSDFPPTPVVDPTGNTPPNAPGLFGGNGDNSAGPCILDPQDGSLLPQNWLRPRFSFTPASMGQNLFEIRIHTAAEMNDLVVYTTQNPWKLPAQYWTPLQQNAINKPLTVSIRAATYNSSSGMLTAGPSKPTTSTITIAPAAPPGAIVYWTADRTTGTPVTALRGFSIGDETVHDVMPTAAMPSAPPCLGCHTSTPDGLYVAFSFTQDNTNGDNAQLRFVSTNGNLSAPPTTMVSTMTTSTLLTRGYQQFPSFAKTLWDMGDRTMISMLSVNSGGTYDIYWTDLLAGTSGALPHTGDGARLPGAASFSNSGMSVVYASGTINTTGYQMTDGQIRVVPFNNRKGGASMPLKGASDSTKNQFYPSYSDDDSWITFTRIDSTTESNLKQIGTGGVGNPLDEVYIVPAGGGTATRLAANDPPSCSSMLKSPGLTNSYAKWAPASTTSAGLTYYWVVFSSKRSDVATTDNPAQLYVTPIVVNGAGAVTTYPALYLWNQPGDQGNHTPAWVDFTIPIS